MEGNEKVALVTGGSGGIGYGIAESLLAQGYAVTVTARQEAKLSAAAERLGQSGTVEAMVCDVRSDEAIETLFAAHRERFGRLDVLVNNAGVATAGPIGSQPTKALDLSFAVNLRAAALCCREAVEMLTATAPSHIVNVASLTGLRPEGFMTAYSAAKAGLVGLSISLQKELAPKGVKAMAICPGFVDTAMADAVRGVLAEGELITVADVVEVFNAFLRLSPGCTMPVVPLESLAGDLQGWDVVSEQIAGGR